MRIILIILAVVTAIAMSATAQKADAQTTYSDSPEWWASASALTPELWNTAQHRDVLRSNFTILGVHLDDAVLEKAATRLGAAAIVASGDASTAQAEACYVSKPDEGNVHLVFARGEIDQRFTLFVGGPDWDTSTKCVATELISRNVTTASGIHLGQTPAQVVAILGRPNKQTKDMLIYVFALRKRTDPAKLRKGLKANTQMSDADFHANYDFYDWNASFVARFVDSRLVYFSAATQESY